MVASAEGLLVHAGVFDPTSGRTVPSEHFERYEIDTTTLGELDGLSSVQALQRLHQMVQESGLTTQLTRDAAIGAAASLQDLLSQQGGVFADDYERVSIATAGGTLYRVLQAELDAVQSQQWPDTQARQDELKRISDAMGLAGSVLDTAWNNVASKVRGANRSGPLTLADEELTAIDAGTYTVPFSTKTGELTREELFDLVEAACAEAGITSDALKALRQGGSVNKLRLYADERFPFAMIRLMTNKIPLSELAK